MPKWTIEGARRETGEDVVVSVEAQLRTEAMSRAEKMGILVSQIIPPAAAPADVLPTETPQQLDYAASATTIVTKDVIPPDYPDIVKGNGILKICATILGGFGWVGVVIAILTGLYAASGNPGALSVVIAALLYSLPCFIGAAMLRMYAALALAIRDIARNSFK